MNSVRRLILPAFALAALNAVSPARSQIVDTADDVVAGIPVNYQESEVGTYTLPDPLTLANGEPVPDAQTWFERRRPEIVRLLEAEQFGKTPGRPSEMTFEVTIYFTDDRTDKYVDVLLYLPADADGPVPLLLQAGWTANNLAVEDEGVKVGRIWNAETQMRSPATGGRRFGGGLNVMQLIERGYGTATFHYNDIEPDALDSVAGSIRAAYLEDPLAEPEGDEWRAIAAWAWGISRIVDYLETDADVDASRIALTGASRLGQTALWAGARDERIALVIVSVSGEGGAALSRREYGETVAHLVAPTRFPYWYDGNYAGWAGRMRDAPFDSHLIVSLVAPRPLLLQTGSTDKWSDPYGEFLAAKAATPVYELLGESGIEQFSQPPIGEPIMNTLGYVMHDGGHGVLPADWLVFLDFMDKYLKAR
jgi:hypothetical protein